MTSDFRQSGDQVLKVRMPQKTARRIQWLADTYAGGNVSLWMRYAALEADRRYLVRDKRGLKPGSKRAKNPAF